MRWTNERQFEREIAAAVQTVGERVPSELVHAIIAVESGFEPRLVRGEPARAGLPDSNASIGLMQLLGSTARALGYDGALGSPADLSGLFDPLTNVTLGVRYLDQVLGSTGGDLEAAASAYNGGYRPQLGFGAKRTAQTPPVCLQWKATAPAANRSLARDCALLGSTIPGTFSNEKYVARVRDAVAYFFASGQGGATLPPVTVTAAATGPTPAPERPE